MPTFLLGVGSNAAAPRPLLNEAVSRIQRLAAVESLRRAGDWQSSAAGGPSDQAVYVNTALVITAQLDPHQLLGALQDIELSMGRVRLPTARRWGPRPIDLDLVLCDDPPVCATNQLTLPHPRWATRQFVIQPAAELAPDWVDPVSGLTIAQVRDRWNRPQRSFALIGFPSDQATKWLDDVDQRTRCIIDADGDADHGTSAPSWAPRQADSDSRPSGEPLEWSESAEAAFTNSSEPAGEPPRLWVGQWGSTEPQVVLVPGDWYPRLPASGFPWRWLRVPRVPLQWDPVQEILAAVQASDPAGVRRLDSEAR